MELQDILHWLRDGEDWEAADLLAQCEFSYHYVDTGFPLSGGPDIDIFELNIHAPRAILKKIGNDLAGQTTLLVF